ncbi:hypothetical protein GF324_12080, partial [bacterium]|nr:hypothetical protein [bacterium]
MEFDIEAYLHGGNGHRGKAFWVLLDPDREEAGELRRAARQAVEEGADGILVGSSYYERNDFDTSVQAVRE